MKSNLLICIKRLREPGEEDIQNLKFKRIAQDTSTVHPIEEEPLEDENQGDGFMRDLELDMMGEISDDDDGVDTTGRLPPQWTPDRILANMVVEVVGMAGTEGIDTASLRDLTTGFFWKRPLESLVTRLTEDWHLNQPLHTRHLAIVRDTTMANDTKRVHYVYRTHENFQKAVDEGEVTWEALQLEKGKKSKQAQPSATSIDSLGFHTPNPNDFHKRTGSSTLSEACGSIVRKQRYTRDWESILLNGSGDKQASRTPERRTPKVQRKSSSGVEQRAKKDLKIARPLLTQAERVALGLPAKGRLGIEYESQIRAHRKKTGNPNSIPEKILKGVLVDQSESKPTSRCETSPNSTLLTREKPTTSGLPEHGLLSVETTVQALIEQGRKEPLTYPSDPAVVINGDRTSDAINEIDPRGSEEHLQDDHNSNALSRSQVLERANRNSIDNQVATLINDNVNQTLQTTRTPVIDLESSALEPVPSQYSENSPTSKRGKGKRLAEEQAMRSKKRFKKNMDRPADESLIDVHNSFMQSDGCANAATLSTTMNRMPEMEPHAQEQKAKHEEHLLPGLYINPNATKPGKRGRGRPKKMLLATFKLSTLHTLDWFIPDQLKIEGMNNMLTDVTAPVGAPDRQSSLPLKSDAVRPPSACEANGLQVTNSETTIQDPNDNVEQWPPNLVPLDGALAAAPDEEIEPEPSYEVKVHEMGIQSPKPMSLVSSASNEDFTPMEIDEQETAANLCSAQVLEKSTAVPEMVSLVEKETLKAVQTIPDRNSALIATPRPPPAMSGVTFSSTNSYHSPYDQTPTQTQLEIPTSEETVPSVSNGIYETNALQDPSDPFGVNALEAHTSGRASKKKKDSSVRVGGGSVSHTRTKLIRHVFDLCDGILPGIDVIYNVFPAIWSELGPKKISCPIDGTIRDAIRAMCPDELVKTPVQVDKAGVPGRKRKTIWSRNDIDGAKIKAAWLKMCDVYPRKYCPPGLSKYWKEEEKPLLVLPKTSGVYVAEVYPPASRRLDDRIKQARRDRKKALKIAKEEQRRRERFAKKEAKRLAKEQKYQEKLDKSGSRQKLFKQRQRLIGLNDGVQTGLGDTVLQSAAASGEPHTISTMVDLKLHSREGSLGSVSSEEEPLVNLRPVTQSTTAGESNASTTVHDGQFALRPPPSSHLTGALMNPTTHLHSSTHTFSTNFTVEAGKRAYRLGEKCRKRVRIHAPVDQGPRKKPRTVNDSQDTRPTETEDDFLVRHHIDIRESSDEQDEQDEQDEEDEKDTSPTTAERLAGLTGDLAQPDYEPHRKKPPTWSQRQEVRRRDRQRRSYSSTREAKIRRLPETFDPLEEFRKLCYTLIIASSMAGENGNVDWDIVSKVYSEVPRFDLQKTKKTWAWMQMKMAQQLRSMADSFQSQFLSAYEEGKVEPIENPGSYDWVKLVRWALTNCTHVEPPLPVARETMDDCHFDVSSYDILDRKIWSNTPLANVGRDERLAKYSFGSPLHGKRSPSVPENEVDVKARSLVRVTISTPKDLYDKNVAHSKLKDIPEHVINRTVHDFLRASLIKERKVKRQVPGRNYLFAGQFGKHYRRTFDLLDFMIAVQLKKDLDATFSNPDPDKRIYSVSRMAQNGVVMALMSLASEGRVRLVPKLPPIKNEFNAPLPRISVWGFSEGDYQHRLMDRKRLFWPIEVVPTDTYQYGNPLHPSSTIDNTKLDHWEPIPDPPLSVHGQSQNPLLPIWSTIDGQTLIYPWWHRILSIVIQSLLFSPGLTPQDILARCETYTTEIFEVQLVLDWLVHVGGAKRSNHGTYEVSPSYWAVFGDKLIGEESDEFGEHVRRRPKNMKVEDTWRTEYNREYNLRTTETNEADNPQESASQQVFHNVRKQYTIAKHVVAESVGGTRGNDGQQKGAAATTKNRGGQSRTSSGMAISPGLEQGEASTPSFTPVNTPSNGSPDVEMTDADADAEGEDIDAEGESDDAEGESDDEFM